MRLIERDRAVSAEVLDALRAVDRAGFVPPGEAARAYSDRPIAIPDRQTTSQPSLVAWMVDRVLEGLEPPIRVLEIGTGYGFQTALLARLCEEVYSVERHERLAEAASENLRNAGITNAHIRIGDGFLGWEDEGPFKAIVVSAAAPGVPGALRRQLDEGGRLVIPIEEGHSDNVYLFVKTGGELSAPRLITPARFVPLVPGAPPPRPSR